MTPIHLLLNVASEIRHRHRPKFWNLESTSVRRDPKKVGDEDVKNELFALFRHQTHLYCKRAQSGNPAAIRCRLDEEGFSLSHQGTIECTTIWSWTPDSSEETVLISDAPSGSEAKSSDTTSIACYL
ncbi:hypothetical protein J6590_064227 [Homalodisca vitripennis]|nr:hypothetical protein J6590_064227 [Homalodisca vitripennis]